MKREGFFALIFALMMASGNCQQQKLSLQEADLLFQQKRYASALPVYLAELKRSSSNGNTFYKAGVCYLNSRSQKSKAAELLEKAITNSTSFYTKGYAKETDAPIDAYLFLGDAYHINYDFDKAIASYEKYKEMLISSKIKDDNKFKVADSRIEVSAFAKELKETVGLPSNFNVPALVKAGQLSGESTAVLSPDKSTMIYTLKVPVDHIKKFEDERFFKPIVPQPLKKEVKFSKPEKKKNEPDTIVNICTLGTSSDGQMVLTYHNERGEACLYLIRLKNNKWTTPTKLAKTANDKGWEPGEHVSADGKYLYFSSERNGGYGGKDIYRCEKLPNGEWSIAQNLGPDINTQYDEEAPYPHADGVTLYFSSNRFKPSLSSDIMTSKAEGKTWSKPIVVGYPINSSENDIFYQVSETKKQMLASADNAAIPEKGKVKPADKASEKENIKKENKDSEQENTESINQLLSFEDPANLRAAMLTGEVKSQQGKVQTALGASITMMDAMEQKLMGVYYSDRERGEYSFLLPTGKKAAIWYEAPGFLFASEFLNVEKDKMYSEKRTPVVLQPLQEEATTTLNNIFFGKEDAVISGHSEFELQKVYDLMISNPSIHIKVLNYIYAPDKSLKKLSNERAVAVKNYLEQKGIDKKRIKAKGVRESTVPGRDKKKGPPKPEDLEPVQQLKLEITEINN